MALRTGRLDAAADHLAESRRLYAEEGDQQGESQVLELLAEVALAAGDTNEALALVTEAAATSSVAELPAENAAAQALLGRVSFQTGDLHQAEAAYRRALELFDELGKTAPVIEVKALLATMLQTVGRSTEARALADEVIEHVRDSGVAGISDPVAALLSTREVVEAQGDHDTTHLTELARRHVTETAAKITDPEIQTAYLTSVADHWAFAGNIENSALDE